MNTITLLNDAPLTRISCRMIKRIFDIITALLVLVLICPWALLAIGCCIKLFMPGSILFKQRRTGKDGRIFVCYKIRTMNPKNKADEYNDPGINAHPLANFLRLTGLDELPQFWNVLKGDMSMIGPRPHMLIHDEEYAKEIANYYLRYSVKPGITGWAQVNKLRGEKDIEKVRKRVEYDLWYIQYWSLGLDMKIIVRTIGMTIKNGLRL